MPIKAYDDVAPKFPRLGKLRKGGEKSSTGSYGPDLDHFRFTSENPDIVRAFYDAYGPKPALVQAYLPYASWDECFTYDCEVWGKSGLSHRCDGETMSVWLEGSKYVRGSKPCAGGHTKDDPLRDAIGRLYLIVPELIQAGYSGYVVLETHSKNDLLHIISVLKNTQQLRGENPLGLRGILFNVTRAKENISVPGFGKTEGGRTRVDKYLVKITPAPEWVLLSMNMNAAAQLGTGKAEIVPELPETTTAAGYVVDVNTGEIIEDAEFIPAPTTPAGVPAQPEPVQTAAPAPVENKISAAVTAAMIMTTPKGAMLKDLSVDELMALKKWLADSARTPDQRQKYGKLADATNTMLDYRQS